MYYQKPLYSLIPARAHIRCFILWRYLWAHSVSREPYANLMAPVGSFPINLAGRASASPWRSLAPTARWKIEWSAFAPSRDLAGARFSLTFSRLSRVLGSRCFVETSKAQRLMPQVGSWRERRARSRSSGPMQLSPLIPCRRQTRSGPSGRRALSEG